MLQNFMIIDDDPINNGISSRYIQLAIPGSTTLTFTVPADAVEYIRENYPLPDLKKTVLLLDINMPVITGWEVLDALEKMSPAIQDSFSIFMFTSSVAEEDKENARRRSLVSGFIEKPLSTAEVRRIATL